MRVAVVGSESGFKGSHDFLLFEDEGYTNGAVVPMDGGKFTF